MLEGAGFDGFYRRELGGWCEVVRCRAAPEAGSRPIGCGESNEIERDAGCGPAALLGRTIGTVRRKETVSSFAAALLTKRDRKEKPDPVTLLHL